MTGRWIPLGDTLPVWFIFSTYLLSFGEDQNMTYKSLTAAVVKEVFVTGLGFFFYYYLSHLYPKKKKIP